MSWSSFVRNSTRAVSRGSQLLSCSVAKHAVCSQTSLMALGSSRASVQTMFAASSITQLQRSLQSAPLSMLARSVMQSAPAMPPPASTSTVAGSSDTTSLEAGSSSEGGASGVLMGSDDEENIPRRQKSKHRPPDRQHDPGGDIYLLSSSERKQRQLLPHEQKELDARAKELKSLKGLKRVKMGLAGPTAGWLATVGIQLACHELLEVVLPQGSPYPREFVSGLLENSQDCVPVSSRGRFLVMYRDRNLPRPASNLLPGRAPTPLPESSDGRGSSHPLPAPCPLQPSSLTQAELTSGSRGSNQVPKAPHSSNASSGGQTVPHDPAYMQAWASAQAQGPGTAGSRRDSVPDAAGARLGAGDSSPPLTGRRGSHYHRDTELLAPASAKSANCMPDRLKRALAIRLPGLRLRLKRTQCG